METTSHSAVVMMHATAGPKPLQPPGGRGCQVPGSNLRIRRESENATSGSELEHAILTDYFSLPLSSNPGDM